MKIPLDELKSRIEFETDGAYQRFYAQIFTKYKLDDGYNYVIDLVTGAVHKKGKSKKEPDKISKSDQKTNE